MPILILPSRLHSGGPEYDDSWVIDINNQSGHLSIVNQSPITVSTINQTITIGITPNYFLRKSGDTVWGNLLMSPSGGGYGLKLHTHAGEPTQSALGAIYYKTSDNTLRVFDGTEYRPVGQVDALTETGADSIYLRLSGSNGPMTGELRLGTQLLRLGAKSSDPSSGVDGQIYFHTGSKAVRLYHSGMWNSIGGAGVTSITASNGILINGVAGGELTDTGTIAVNQGFDYNWSGSHAFQEPITFASDQTFDIAKLSAAGQQTGDLILLTSTGWQRLAKGSDAQILTINATTHQPAWADPSTVTNTIGTPTDSSYLDGYFVDWESTTPIADAVDDISELLLLLVPAQSGVLTAQNLNVTTPPTIISAVKLSNMPGTQLNKWINKRTGSPLSPGDTIANGYYRQGALTAATPVGTFRAGKVGDSSTWGQVSHKIYRWTGSAITSTLLNTFDMTPGITGTSGTIELTTFTTFNSLWKQGSARISAYASPNEGYTANSILHTGAGESNTIEYWYDSASAAVPNPSFSSAPAATEVTPVLKYLSGISYYGLNSTFTVAFAAASGIFDRCYNASQVAQFSGTGINAAAHKFSPSSVPMYNDAYDCTASNAKTATLDTANQNSMTKAIIVNLYKADNTTVAASASLSRAVNTWSIGATDVLERFVDESYRLVLNTTTAWNSTSPLTNGNAQVYNGSLLHGAAGDYSSHTLPAEYQRFVFINSRSTGTITFTGFNATNISSYGTGSVNILLQLESPNKYFDLGLAVGTGGDGSSPAAAIGARNGLPLSGGTVINFSFGTDSTQVSGVGNNGRFRIIIIFRDTTYSITQFTVS